MKRRIQLEIPALTAEQALVVVDVLDAVINALWDAHGDGMVAILADKGVLLEPEHPDSGAELDALDAEIPF